MPHLEVLAARPQQAALVANLLELYVHDFSEFLPIEVGDDGRFGYPPLPLYWSDPERHPFLVRVDSKLAGVALVKRSVETTAWDMAEFFIVRAHRRAGIGTRVAHEIWKLFPGLWEVRVMEANASGRRFWAGAIAKFTGRTIDAASIESQGKRWSVFSFASPVIS